ncbi:MAG: hypothetical protein WB579_05305 [Bryobacteraceae bacterium]
MKHRFALLAFLLCMMALTASAQNWGPYAPATTGKDYPANLCASYTSNTCIIYEACSPYHGAGYCSPEGPGGNHEDSGGVGKLYVQVTNNQGFNQGYDTNSTSYSEGYIVIIGTPGVGLNYQDWGFEANVAWDPGVCTWTQGAGGPAITAFGSSKTYYRTMQLCE